jgi:hypothetical protein
MINPDAGGTLAGVVADDADGALEVGAGEVESAPGVDVVLIPHPSSVRGVCSSVADTLQNKAAV